MCGAASHRWHQRGAPRPHRRHRDAVHAGARTNGRWPCAGVPSQRRPRGSKTLCRHGNHRRGRDGRRTVAARHVGVARPALGMARRAARAASGIADRMVVQRSGWGGRRRHDDQPQRRRPAAAAACDRGARRMALDGDVPASRGRRRSQRRVGPPRHARAPRDERRRSCVDDISLPPVDTTARGIAPCAEGRTVA